MILRSFIAAAVIALAVPVAAQAAAPVVQRAGSVTVIEQQDPSAPLVHIEFLVRAGLDRQTLQQNGLAALTAQTILRTKVNGTPLEDAISAHGGEIRPSVDAADVRFAIESIPSEAPAVVALVQHAFASPSIGGATVNSARTELMKRIAMNQQQALQVGLDMLNGMSAPSANVGLPALGIPASLAQFGPEEVRAFFNKYYHQGGAYVSAVGRSDVLPQGALASLAQTLPAGDTAVVNIKLPKLEGTSHELIAHRDIDAPWLVAQYSAPAIDSRDFGAMLVLSAFLQRTLADIAEVPGVVSPTFASHAVGALYQYDRAPANLTLYVNGGIGNPNRAFATALSIASILAATKLEGSISEFKAMAAGDFVNDATSLESRAWLAVLFAQNGSSPDYLNRTLEAIQSTTAGDLQRVARTYMGNPAIALVLPRDKTNP